MTGVVLLVGNSTARCTHAPPNKRQCWVPDRPSASIEEGQTCISSLIPCRKLSTVWPTYYTDADGRIVGREAYDDVRLVTFEWTPGVSKPLLYHSRHSYRDRQRGGEINVHWFNTHLFQSRQWKCFDL